MYRTVVIQWLTGMHMMLMAGHCFAPYSRGLILGPWERGINISFLPFVCWVNSILLRQIRSQSENSRDMKTNVGLVANHTTVYASSLSIDTYSCDIYIYMYRRCTNWLCWHDLCASILSYLISSTWNGLTLFCNTSAQDALSSVAHHIWMVRFRTHLLGGSWFRHDKVYQSVCQSVYPGFGFY